MPETLNERPPQTADELVARTVAGALALQEADIYGKMDVKPIEPLPPVRYSGHDLVFVPELQPSNVFKYRGTSAAASKAAETGYDSVETVSTGSHGISLCMSAARLGLRTTVHVPGSITSTKRQRLEVVGANVIQGGSFSEAKARAQTGKNGLFIHPFANQEVRNGQATLGLELTRYLEWMGLTGFDEDVVIPVALAGGSHTIGIAGPVAVAKQEGRLGPGVKIVALRSKSGKVDAININESDRDPANQLVLEDSRYVAETNTVADRQIGEALPFLEEHGINNAESAGAMPTAYALAYARRYPYSRGNNSKKFTFVLPVSGLNGSPESNAPFIDAATKADRHRAPQAVGRLTVPKLLVANPTEVRNTYLGQLAETGLIMRQ